MRIFSPPAPRTIISAERRSVTTLLGLASSIVS
jgi:hypothetical protein